MQGVIEPSTYKHEDGVCFTLPSLDHLFIQSLYLRKLGRRASIGDSWYMNESTIHQIESQQTAVSLCLAFSLNTRFRRGHF